MTTLRHTPQIKIDFCREDGTSFETGQGETMAETDKLCLNRFKKKYKKSESRRSKLWDAIEDDRPGDIPKIVKEENIQVNELTSSLIHEAAFEGKLESVKALLDCGTKVNLSDTDDWTVLHAAVLGGHVDLVRLLIQRGADLYAETNEKYIPFHIATEKGDEDMVALLMEKMSQLSTLNAN